VTDQGEELARAVRTRFPAALIDEFQDTDPLQFGIFRKIYVPENEPGLPLFLVGDPKQAIYRFRNADLHTYLLAQQEAKHKHSLPKNQRSVPGLIGAGNVLFGVNERAFLQPGIDYRPVGLGQKQATLAPFTDKSAEARADLQIWTLRTDDDGVPTHEEAKQLAAHATVGEIVRLLNAGMAGEIRVGDRELTAGDIAVLVRSHREGKLMRRTLEAQGVSCVELSLASVWTTLEAEELERILLAVAEKRDNLLRAALATDLLGGTAETLEALGQDEARFFARVERFASYRDLWETKGFPVMFRQLLRDEAVESRLLGQPAGERRLTNLLHLGELIATAAQTLEGIDALLRWLHGCRTEITGGEGAQLRLESDSQRVKIITIHKSKGLEYPFVFCPFLWDGYRNANPREPDLRQYYDSDAGGSVTDFDPASYGSDRVKALIRFEDAAESVRLMYVALTRAVYRSYLIAGAYSKASKNGPSFGESSRSLLNWLVCGNGVAPEDWFDSKKSNQRTPQSILQAWQSLAQATSIEVAPNLSIDPLPVLVELPVLNQSNSPREFSARKMSRSVEEAWNRGSFSGMIRHRPVGEEGADHDQDIAGSKKRSPKPDDLEASDILDFPQGAFAGNCLHSLFEHADFAASDQWSAAIDRALMDYPQPGADKVREQMTAVLTDVLNTPLPNGTGDTYHLAHVPRADQLRELPFTLSTTRLGAQPLNALVHQVGLDVPRLAFRDIQGYLNGAIDLVFRHGGRYYLLDWKSNHLGYSARDYALPRLRDEMREHAYALQSLVYTLSLHRFLASRLPDYDYERDFGGSYYLFVRGVRPDWQDENGFPTGVLYERTPGETVMAFDQLLLAHDHV
jgi:exodeoxyribonuclease V beta subunit